MRASWVAVEAGVEGRGSFKAMGEAVVMVWARRMREVEPVASGGYGERVYGMARRGVRGGGEERCLGGGGDSWCGIVELAVVRLKLVIADQRSEYGRACYSAWANPKCRFTGFV